MYAVIIYFILTTLPFLFLPCSLLGIQTFILAAGPHFLLMYII